MKVVGIDSAFRNLGIVEAEYDGVLIPYRLALIKTTSHPEKTRALDDFEEAKKIWSELEQYLKKNDLVIFELPYGSQNSRAGKLLGMVTGIMACAGGIPISPLAVKKVVKEKATKKEMVEWGREKYPHLNWEDFNKGDHEHLADAIALLHAFFEV